MHVGVNNSDGTVRAKLPQALQSRACGSLRLLATAMFFLISAVNMLCCFVIISAQFSS